MSNEGAEPEKTPQLPNRQSGRAAALRVRENVWDIPTTFKEGMRVPGRIFASEKLMQEMDEQVFDQLTNVAILTKPASLPSK